MNTQTHEIVFEPSGQHAEVDRGTTLLEAARSVGLPVASACGADGICGRCGMQILAGGEALPRETDAERAIKQRNRIEPDLRLSCRIQVQADLVVTATYW